MLSGIDRHSILHHCFTDPNPGHPFASFVALPQDVNGQMQFPEGHPAYGLRHGQGLPPPPPSPPSAGAPSSQRSGLKKKELASGNIFWFSCLLHCIMIAGDDR